MSAPAGATPAAAPTFTTRPACPVCADPGVDRLADLAFDEPPLAGYLDAFYEGRIDPADLASARYRLVRCTGCGLLYQQEVLDPAGMAWLYGDVNGWDHEATSRSRDLSVRLRYLGDQERLVRHLGRAPADIEVLDLGAGAGLWLDLAQALGLVTNGVEANPGAAADLARRGHRVLALEDLPDDTFDFVNTEQVMEHLAEPAEVGAALARSLRSGGLLRISVPNATGIADRLARADWQAPKGSAGSLNAVAPLEHVNGFDHRSLLVLGERLGLEPFVHGLRTEIHATARIRYAASAVLHRVRRPAGTMLLFRKP
jgi:SAM-dependent methyltransferase